jgi:arylsulfatase A-like enzyme
MKPEMGAGEISAVDERYPKALETLQAVDEMITNLVDLLRAAGTLEQTYIVLSSDNGYHYGEHRLALEKSSPYEESIRVPLVVRGPGIPAGQTIPALASLVDLAPTFAAWGDAIVPDFVDGRSLAPLLTNNSSAMPWRHAVLIDHDANGDRSKIDPATFNALRTVDHLYAEYITGEREFYDLVNDPYQLENLAESADPALIQTLSARLAAMTTCAGETCRAIEATPL